MNSTAIPFGKQCTAVDYEGNILPWIFTPERFVFDNKYVECRTPTGGLVHIKPERLTRVKEAKI